MKPQVADVYRAIQAMHLLGSQPAAIRSYVDQCGLDVGTFVQCPECKGQGLVSRGPLSVLRSMKPCPTCLADRFLIVRADNAPQRLKDEAVLP